jgi:asparagine N-glycosylation enzyme membrane subunit Stt3
MPTLFGQRIEPGFDIEKEKRSNRVGWAIFGGLAIAVLYQFFGGRFSVQVFQGLTASVLFYGANFYAPFPNRFREWWLSKALLATVPLHAAHLWALFGWMLRRRA